MLACTACTVVQVNGGEIRRFGGILRVAPLQDASTVSITSRNYGVIADGHSLLLGYGKSRIIVVPDTSRCSAVIIMDDSSENLLSQWREFFGKYPNICIE